MTDERVIREVGIIEVDVLGLVPGGSRPWRGSIWLLLLVSHARKVQAGTGVYGALISPDECR